MHKIELSHNKVLKLTNVLILELSLVEINSEVEQMIFRMDNYIRSKGAIPVGPIIQKSSVRLTKEGQVEPIISYLRQTNSFINHVETPYKFASTIRTTNCIYARFIGPGEKLKLAYDKINVTAFEEGVELNSESYTVFVDQQGEIILADVFVEKVH